MAAPSPSQARSSLGFISGVNTVLAAMLVCAAAIFGVLGLIFLDDPHGSVPGFLGLIALLLAAPIGLTAVSYTIARRLAENGRTTAATAVTLTVTALFSGVLAYVGWIFLHRP